MYQVLGGECFIHKLKYNGAYCPQCQAAMTVTSDVSGATISVAHNDRIKLESYHSDKGWHGWICPKCERVYSPTVGECGKCNK